MTLAKPTWPDDFISLASGRFRVRADLVATFRKRGWLRPEDVLDDDSLSVFRRVDGRENAVVTLEGPTGRKLQVYVKRHHASAAQHSWPVKRRRPDPPGWAEADASGWCQEAGVGIAPVVAAGYDLDERGRHARSFFMSEALVGYEPADDWIRRIVHLPPENACRWALMKSLADVARHLHGAGLFHRDFYWCHFFVREASPRTFDVRLIDLQRVHRPRWRRWRWRLKDLAQFVFSAPAGFLVGSERQEWLANYFDLTALGPKEKTWLTAIETRAELYRWREKAA